ncbi:MAG TPA: NUDIX domain-containing protein [Candidatus Saccharimonadales bacterium]|nr:NUDIX domain-containing protein [Candidatus Saccharimonadales bacterium]
MPNEQEEILDIVDANDSVIGQIPRTEYYRTDTKPGYVRAVNLFLINSSGKIWVPRRAASQKIKPNALDFSAGGHVSAGETYELSMLREAEEELGIKINPDELRNLGRLVPEDSPGRHYYFCECFAYYSDEAPHYTEQEFSGHEWLLPEELLAKIESGEDAKESIKDALKLLMDYQAERIGN